MISTTRSRRSPARIRCGAPARRRHNPGSPLTASMFRDIEAKRRTEEDHIVGDLLRRADPSHPTPVLRIVQAHLAAYEARRASESATT
jgi:2-dehydropantoate 2-reductase